MENAILKCRVCGADQVPWPRQWLGFKWGTCRQCGSVQKLLDEDQFQALAPTYDAGYLEHDTVSAPALRRRMDVAGKRAVLLKLLGADMDGSLLDIGCGMGAFLLAGRDLGLQVCGVEPSAAHCKAAVEYFGLEVIPGYFRAESFDRQFDTVILSHVIEHIRDPRAFLTEVFKVLRPGGRLVLITPNCGSLSARACGKYWSMYKPVDHVTLLGKAAMARIIPPGAVIDRLETSEWPGEFAAHVLSAIKTALRPALSNTGATAAHGTMRRSTIGSFARWGLAVVSLPFHAIARARDSQSCLYAVIRLEQGA